MKPVSGASGLGCGSGSLPGRIFTILMAVMVVMDSNVVSILFSARFGHS